jgi:hypothetical protein
MNFTELGIMRDDKDEHPEKHSGPKDVTELGMVRDDLMSILQNKSS